MEPTQTGAQAITKVLAIIGLFALISLIVWFVVQGVRLFPSAFTSLASIAETVGGYRPNSELTIDLEKSIVNSGETFTLRWTDMGKGSYTFSYVCTTGVLLSVRASDGALREVPCGDALTLTDDVHGLFVSISAREQRFSDVDFQVAFDAQKGDTHVAEGRVTIVNATVPTRPDVPVVAEVPSKPRSEAVTPDAPKTIALPPKTATTQSPTAVAPSLPQVAQGAASVVSLLPKSYEDGFVDLRAMYLGVGTLENGVFVPKATFTESDTAAFRFEVKNIGTKTSDTWSYALSLPQNVAYTSEPQTGLTPNEKAIFTIGFALGDTTLSSVKVGGEVTTTRDTNNANNKFDWSVKIAQ